MPFFYYLKKYAHTAFAAGVIASINPAFVPIKDTITIGGDLIISGPGVRVTLGVMYLTRASTRAV